MMISHYVKSGILNSENYSLSSLKVVMTGGAKIDKNTIEEFKKCLPHVSFFNVYGSKTC